LVELRRLAALLFLVVAAKSLPGATRRRHQSRLRRRAGRTGQVLLLSSDGYLSAFAARVVRSRLRPAIKVVSAGLRSRPERALPPGLAAIAADSADTPPGKPLILDRRMVEQADLIFVFDFDDLLGLFFRFPTAPKKTLFVGAFADDGDLLV